MYCQKYRLRKIWLHKYLKKRVSDEPYTENMASLSKHSRNLNGRTFTKFIKHLEGSVVGKSLF